MKSRVSYFDKGVFRTDLTRFAPIWVLYGVFGIFTISSFFLQTVDGGFPMGAMLAEMPLLLVGTNMWLGVAAAVLLFGDLCKSKMCNGLHAMPLRRETWFGSHFAAGMAYSLIPNTVFAVILGIMAGADWYMAPLVLLCATMQYLFFFGVALFSIHCSGRSSATVVIFFVINFFSMMVYWLVESFYMPLLPGVTLDEAIFSFFSPTIQCYAEPVFKYDVIGDMIDKAKYQFYGFDKGFWYLLGMGAVGVVFSVLALLLYRKRQLETAGDFISARGVKPVFLVIYTLCIAAVVQSMLGGMVLSLPLGLAVGYFTGQMILQRKANIFNKRAFAGFGLIAGVMLLTLLIVGLDPLGRVKWVPKEEQVKSVSISQEYYYGFGDNYYTAELTATDPELQEEIIRLHQAIVDEGIEGNWLASSYMDYDYWETVPVYLVYEMEDGTKVRRFYSLDMDSKAAAAAMDFYSKPEYVFGYEDWDAYLSQVTKVEVAPFTFSGQQAKELLEAVKADCELGRMSGFYDTYQVKVYVDVIRGEYSDFLHIYENCTNTISWLNTNAPGWQNY